MAVPQWMMQLSQSTGVSTKVIISITVLLVLFAALGALGVTALYLYHNDPVFRRHAQ